MVTLGEKHALKESSSSRKISVRPLCLPVPTSSCNGLELTLPRNLQSSLEEQVCLIATVRLVIPQFLKVRAGPFLKGFCLFYCHNQCFELVFRVHYFLWLQYVYFLCWVFRSVSETISFFSQYLFCFCPATPVPHSHYFELKPPPSLAPAFLLLLCSLHFSPAFFKSYSLLFHISLSFAS